MIECPDEVQYLSGGDEGGMGKYDVVTEIEPHLPQNKKCKLVGQARTGD